MGHDRTYHFGPIQITKHFLDWGELGPGFGDFARLTFQRFCAIPPGSKDHIYLNPAFTVKAEAAVPEKDFLRQARRACILWMKQITRRLGSKARKRAVKQAKPGDRMLAFSGTLMLSGRLVHIKRLDVSSNRPTFASS